MLDRVFPRQAAEYRGQVVALWVFSIVLLLKTGISASSVFNAHEAAASADGIPLDSFPAAAAREVLTTFILLGWSNLVFCLVALVVLARYRGLVPLMYLLWIVYEIGKRVMFLLMPVDRTGGTAGAIITRTVLAVMVVGFVLSLWSSRRRHPG